MENEEPTDAGNIWGVDVFDSSEGRIRPPRPEMTVHEAARETSVFAETDVLVVGGGPAGTAAAIAAARSRADVILVERYNHLGGLSTGGLVIWIDRMTDWNGEQVIAGIAKDIFDRLPKEARMGPSRTDWGSTDAASAAFWAERMSAFHGIVTWSPTIDPEALKTLSFEMIKEQNVRLLLHSWAVASIVEDGVMRGVIFESKEGRQAILAKTVIDTTGDADLITRAGLPSDTDSERTNMSQTINTAFLLGGVDMERWTAFKTKNTEGFKDFMALGRQRVQFFEKPFHSWRNDVAVFLGPRLSGYNAVDVEDLTEVDLRSRELTIKHLDVYRDAAPGFENAFLMLGAPQVGVRHSRRLIGNKTVVRDQWPTGKVWEDEIGVSTSLSPKFPNISVPFGALVPKGLDGLLAAGRHIACDVNSHSFLREIPQCWMTGHAAGVAAALSANSGVHARNLDIKLVQSELKKQGAYLSSSLTD